MAYSRVPSARRRAVEGAIHDETQSATAQALRELTSGAPKDSAGFDLNGMDENLATFRRAQQKDFDTFTQRMHEPIGSVLAPQTVIPRDEDLLLSQALWERGPHTKVVNEHLPLDEGVATAANPTAGLNPYDPTPLAKQMALRSLGKTF